MRGLLPSVVLLAALATGATAKTRPAAPLPEGVEASGRPRVTGLYAAVAGFSFNEEPTLRLAQETCKARGEAFHLDAPQGDQFTDHAEIYRTQDQYIMFTTKFIFDIDFRACAAKVTRERKIEHKILRFRAIFNVDHSSRLDGKFRTAREAKLSETYGLRWPEPFYVNLATCNRQKCINEVINNTRAECWEYAAAHFVLTRCASVEKDLSYGLSLGEAELPYLDTLMPEAEIDPAVFEVAE